MAFLGWTVPRVSPSTLGAMAKHVPSATHPSPCRCLRLTEMDQ